MLVSGRRVKTNYAHDTAGHVIPGPDGKTLFTARGLWTTDCKPVNPRDQTYYLPTTDPGLHLGVRPGNPADPGGPRPVLSLYAGGTDAPLVTLPQVELPPGFNPWDREPLGFDQRVHLVVGAGVFVILPATNDRLVLYRFDLVAALDRSGIDYLLVTSQPPAVRPGDKLEYRIVTLSKKGGVKYRLESGPPGLTVSAAGVVRWDMPADFKEEEVIVHVSDASGQERFHTFKLRGS
jgi:hypothetical protein